MNGALAIFAKTLGLSPVKTRLTADIGVSLAEAFYALSVEAVAEMAAHTRKHSKNTFTPYWALAEKEGINHPRRQKFPALWTGEGDLGRRLHSIYSTLRQTHDYVIMIGTDSPQLEPAILLDAIKKIESNQKSSVIGPCTDGGFYLFAAAVTISETVWNSVTYSADSTLAELIRQIERLDIPVELLSVQGDIDTIHDLKPLLNALEANHNKLLPAQQKLYRWLKDQKESYA